MRRKNSMQMRILAGAVAVLSAWLLSGCIFSPRDAETPGAGSDPWTVPIEPKIVFLNLASGVHSVTNSNYERSLDETFTFEPRSVDWPGFVDWDKQREMAFLDRIKADYPGEREILFGDEDGIFERENVGVAEAEFYGIYVMTLTRGDASVETYAGKATFFLKKGASGWMLVSWKDEDVYEQNATSGFLRNALQ